MSFTSLGFLCFLALTACIYYLFPKKNQWAILLVASYIFYFLAGRWYLPFIIFTTLSSYICSLLLEKYTNTEKKYIEENKQTMDKEARKLYKARAKKKRFYILVLFLVLNFGVLGVLKYTGFALTNFISLIKIFNSDFTLKIPSLILPLGISFYTFQTMGYLIDVYREKTEVERNIFKLALFVSFFPQLVQGPISRHSDLADELLAEHRAKWDCIAPGVLRIAWGFFKKLVIADTLMIAISTILGTPEKYEGMYVLYLILAYSAEIYADFTGGIDIAIGVGELLGIKITENFNHPFASKSTAEYWKRWHITMGSWFTDYVFYPVSICKPMQKLSKKCRAKLGTNVGKRIPVYLATILTWFLTGLWHGASWNFIVWGLLNCAVILISQEMSPLYSKFHACFPKLTSGRGWEIFAQMRTFVLMGIIRILDCYRNVPMTFKMFSTVFYKFSSWKNIFNGELGRLGLSLVNYMVVAIAIFAVYIVSRNTSIDDPLRNRIAKNPVVFAACLSLLIIATVIFGSYGIGFDASQFIYSQY